MGKLNYGDVIFVDRGYLKHFGVYADDDHVIHFHKKKSTIVEETILEDSRRAPLTVQYTEESIIVEETTLKEFLGESSSDKLYRIVFKKFDGETAVKVVAGNIAKYGAAFVAGGPIGVAGVALASRILGHFAVDTVRYYEGRLFSPSETVRRARSMIGETRYNLLTHNCEDVALWVKTGEEDSEQFAQWISGKCIIHARG